MKNFFKIMIVFMGIILGIYLGELALEIPWLKFLAFGKEIGLTNPVTLDLGFISLTFGFICNLNLAGILGFVVALFIIKKAIK